MPVRVLLADENLAVQKLVELTLNKEGIEVTTTDNGLSALDIAIKNPPDVILADYKMEGLDIASFIQKAKKREHLSTIPIILLINATQTHDPVYLKSLGVETFFKKPIDAQELINGIKKFTSASDRAFDLSDEPSIPNPSDLSQHFTSSEEESKAISEMLGWSTPPDEVQETEQQEDSEQTVFASPFEIPSEGSEAETIGLSPSEDKPFSTADTLAPESIENDPILPSSPPKEDHNEEIGDLSSQEAEPDPFSFPFAEDDPFSPLEPGVENPSADEDTILPPPEMDSGAFAVENDAQDQPSPFGAGLEPAERDETPLASPNREMQPLHATSLEEAEYREPASKAQSPQSEIGMENGAALDAQMMKAVEASTERILKAILPDLVKASLSKEMIADIVAEVAWEAVTPLAEAEIKKAIKHLQAEAE